MNFEFAQLINSNLEKFEFEQALNISETELKKIQTTEFHAILELSLINQTEDLVSWINDFYSKASQKTDIKALYFEMTEFDINTDYWDIFGFYYDTDGGLDSDLNWLCDNNADNLSFKEFNLTGLEKLQIAFANIEPKNKILKDSRDWCEQIIIIRFAELMRNAHLNAKEKKLPWASIPVYFAEHDYLDLILKSEN